MAPRPAHARARRRGITSLSGDALASLLGPAEAQYGEQLVLGLVGAQGPLACGATIVDDDANDVCESEGCLRVDFEWNDLSSETGYRGQVDYDSATLVEENSGFEIAANVTTSFASINQFPGERTHTIRVFGHVGHAPAHGASPIAGDVVSNECSVTFVVPELEPPG